jgi:hypothetical protein
LQLLRQHLVMTELYQSCFAPRDVVQDGRDMDSENTVYTLMIPYIYTNNKVFICTHTHTHTHTHTVHDVLDMENS